MKNVTSIAGVVAAWLTCAVASASPLADGAITYQGQLDEAGGGFFRADSPDGFGGYFIGDRNYFEGNVGIGTTDAHASLLIRDADDQITNEMLVIKDTDDNWIVNFNDAGYFGFGSPNASQHTRLVVEGSGNLIGTSLPRLTVASDVGGTVDVATTYVTGQVSRALTVEALRELRDEKDTEIRSLRDRNRELARRVSRLEARVEQMVATADEGRSR